MSHWGEDDAALVGAIHRLAKGLVRGVNQFDHRDIAQSALLYVIERDYNDSEHRDSVANLKCRGIFIDAVRSPGHSRTEVAAHERLIEIEESAPYVAPPLGLYPQEMRVYAREMVAFEILGPLPKGLSDEERSAVRRRRAALRATRNRNLN